MSLPSAIAPLVHARRTVLIGDPRQSPHSWTLKCRIGFATSLVGPGQDKPAASMAALLTTSLFELLLAETPSSNKVVLTAQYRMPGAVADFLSGKLRPRNALPPGWRQE